MPDSERAHVLRRRVSIPVLGVCACALPWTAPALAETFTFAGRTVIVDPPAGYCALDQARPGEATMIAAIEKLQQPTNHLVMELIDCDQLAQIRAGTRTDFTRYGQVLVTLSNGEVKPARGYSRAGFLEAAARELPSIDPDRVADEVRDRLRNAVPGSAISGAQFLGLIKRDDLAIYLGLTMGTISRDGRPVTAGGMGVDAVTLVNEIPISLAFYRADVGPEAIPDLLAAAQQDIAQLVKANAEVEAREASGWYWHSIDIADVARGALIGGIIGAIGYAFMRFRSRFRKNRTGA